MKPCETDVCRHMPPHKDWAECCKAYADFARKGRRIELDEVLDLLDRWIEQETAVSLFRVEYEGEHQARVTIAIERGARTTSARSGASKDDG